MSNISNNRVVLGKGLSALLPSAEKRDNALFFQCPIDKVHPSPEQPRKEFENIDELCKSITVKGIIQPLLVRKIDKGFEIIAGERRYRAAQKCNLPTVPVIVHDSADQEALELSLIENLQREDLSPLEEATAYRNLMERFSLTQEAIAEKLGKERTTIANTVRLLKLPSIIQDYLREGLISQGHARSILALDKIEDQLVVAKDIVARGMSVRKTEEMIKKFKDDPAEKSRKNVDKTSFSSYESWVKTLQDRLKTTVAIKEKQRKIVISFKDEDDLNRIIAKIGMIFDQK